MTAMALSRAQDRKRVAERRYVRIRLEVEIRRANKTPTPAPTATSAPHASDVGDSIPTRPRARGSRQSAQTTSAALTHERETRQHQPRCPNSGPATIPPTIHRGL